MVPSPWLSPRRLKMRTYGTEWDSFGRSPNINWAATLNHVRRCRLSRGRCPGTGIRFLDTMAGFGRKWPENQFFLVLEKRVNAKRQVGTVGLRWRFYPGGRAREHQIAGRGGGLQVYIRREQATWEKARPLICRHSTTRVWLKIADNIPECPDE